MNDAQQEMSPDFVLMRLVSAAKYDRLDEPDDLMSGEGGFGRVKSALVHGVFDLDPSGPPAGLGSSSPHYSSPLPGKGELDGGLVLPQAPLGSEAPLSSPPAEDFAAAAQRFVDLQNGSGGHGSRAQLMVFQKLLRSGDRILECGLEQPPAGFLLEETERKRQELDSGSGTGPDSGTGSGKNQNLHCTPSAEEHVQPQILPWHPVLQLSRGFHLSQASQQAVPDESASVLCHRRHLLTGPLAQWPPGLLDQALHLGLLEPQKNCPGDPVQSLAQRMGQLGEGREDRTAKGGEMGLLRCSCHSVLASGSGGVGPGEDPSETSDALLVLEGLGSGEVGGIEEGGSSDKGESRGEVSGPAGGAGPVFSSGTLSGLMQQVHRLAEEAGVCTDQNCRSPLAIFAGSVSLPPCVDSHPPTSSPSPFPPVHLHTPPAVVPSAVLPTSSSQSSASEPGSRPQHQHQSLSQPQSRAPTPKLVPGAAGRSASPLLVLEPEVGGGGAAKDCEKTPRGKSRKGGSLKVRLSKLFRTKSSAGGSGGLLDKRPSLASSTSSGGSLLDVWGSDCSTVEHDSSRFDKFPLTGLNSWLSPGGAMMMMMMILILLFLLFRLQVSRPHSAFSPVPFTPAFTGKNVCVC